MDSTISDRRPGKLYLLPSALSDAPVTDVLPQANIAVINRLRHFVVENVRSARRFLRRCNRDFPIDDSIFMTLDEHTHPDELPEMAAMLEHGHDVGVISEAGCPAVADPGSDLVALAQQRGIEVVPLVGPSSILMSLMASGFNGQSFTFLGYLPVESARRAATLRDMERDIMRHNRTQIFIETPYRNDRLIAEMAKTLSPGLKLCVAVDITGPRQSIVTLPVGQWASGAHKLPGKSPAIYLLYK